MGKTRFKSVRLLLKLMLFLQIYFHLEFEVEATETHLIPESFDGIKADNRDGSGSNNQIFEEEVRADVFERQKRPVRLLPVKMIR